MQLVEHAFLPRPTLPIRNSPWIASRVDDFAGPVHVEGLEAGRGIGTCQTVGQHILVEGASADAGEEMRVPAAILRRHRMNRPVTMYLEPDFLLLRRPHPKENAIFTAFGAEAETLSPNKARGLVLGRFTVDRHGA